MKQTTKTLVGLLALLLLAGGIAGVALWASKDEQKKAEAEKKKAEADAKKAEAEAKKKQAEEQKKKPDDKKPDDKKSDKKPRP